MNYHGLRLVGALIATVIVTGGCAAGPRTAEGVDQPPQDFSVDLTILVGTGSGSDAGQQAHHLRQSRYVVLPDGRLHYGEDPSRGAEWLPPPVRTLREHMMRELWLLATDEGFGDPRAGEEPVNFKSMAAAPGEVLYLLAVTGEKDRWAVIRSSRIDAPDPAMQRFVNHLAELAWVEPPSEALRSSQPRYDFGPDPYERYR